MIELLKFIDILIYIFVYLFIFVGIWFITYPILSPIFNRIRVSTRFRIAKINSRNRIKENKLMKHISLLLSTTYGFTSFYSLFTFITISILLFGICYISLTVNNNQVFINFIVSLLVGLVPYIILRIKLQDIRITNSYVAENLIIELINQYKINHYNMIEAIDATIARLSNQSYSQKALFKLSLAIKQYSDETELEEVIKDFNYSINTSWSLLLANNLFLSIEYGDNVVEALEDILTELKELKRINEKNKQYNHETFVMIKYIAPALYMISLYAMFSIFGFTIEKFINFQFKNPTGLKFFILTILFIFINYMIYFLFKKQKNDF